MKTNLGTAQAGGGRHPIRDQTDNHSGGGQTVLNVAMIKEAFAKPNWQESSGLALVCNALIWLIVALPFVIATVTIVRRLAAT